MKIIFTIGGMTDGGAERVVALLSNHFAKMGIGVCICCMGKECEEAVYDPGLQQLCV